MIEDNNYSAIAKLPISNKDYKTEDFKFLQSCMPGNFMRGSDENTYYPYFNGCPEYMSERCSKNWDEYCELYLNNLTIDKLDEAKDFLDKTAIRKYTTFDKNNNMPSCHLSMQMSDPLSPASPIISQVSGNQTYYMNDNGKVRYFEPRLSPTFITPCEKDTSNLKPKYTKGDFSENDGLFQNCMKYRSCGEAIDLSNKTKTVYETRISRPKLNYDKLRHTSYATPYEMPFD